MAALLPVWRLQRRLTVMLRRAYDAGLQVRGDHRARAEAEPLRARRHLEGHHRGALQALRGLREQAERDPREARRRRPRLREPGLLRDPRAQGRALLRGRRDQEPRDLLREPRRRRGRARRPHRRPDQARLRLPGRLARRPQGERDGRARLGLDRVRLGRGPALQLRRRRAEHVTDLERDTDRRARRLRACVLPRLPDRPRLLHRRLLRQPRLVDDQRLGVEEPDPEIGLFLAVVTALVIAIGYLAGSIPTGYWIVRAWRGVDIRTVGSGNIGASNVWRVFGRRYGVPVVLLDVAKGFGPALVGTLLAGDLTGVLAGAAAMLGHWRPLFLRFEKGGKTVATAGDAFLGVAPVVGGIGAAIWLATFLLLRYASLASILAACSLPILAALLGEPWPVIVFRAIAAGAGVLLHRANIARLRAGTENRFRFDREATAR